MPSQHFCPENGAGPHCVYHKCACSELWSLSWLSSLARESPVCWRVAAPMPESSEGRRVPFFTFTSSFSRAAAPCCPPFTLFHFIRLFWNQTFTFNKDKEQSKQKKERKLNGHFPFFFCCQWKNSSSMSFTKTWWRNEYENTPTLNLIRSHVHDNTF